MKQRWLSVLFIWILIVALLSGCGYGAGQQQPVAEGYTVTDSQGHLLQLTHKPQRIVSLTLGTDEIITGLVPANRIAALTHLAEDASISNIVEQAGTVPHKIRAEAETVIALNPDLVLVADWLPADLPQTLRDAGIPVYVYKTPHTIKDVEQTITVIAQVVGESEQGRQLVRTMEEKLAEVRRKLDPVQAGQEKVVAKLTAAGATGGKDSTFADICEQARTVSAAVKAGLGPYDMMTKEQLVASRPDVLLLPTWDYQGKANQETSRADIMSDPGLQSVPAVQTDRLEAIPERYLSCTSQYIVFGVEGVAKAAYPDYMNTK